MIFATEIDLVLLLLRLAVGAGLAAHGYAKFFSGGKIAGTGRWFDSIGMRPGKVHALMAASSEIVVGLLIAAGFLTSFAAMGYVALMVVAHWTVHRANGFFIIKEGWEYVFVLGTVAFTIATIGPGQWSLDHAFGIDDDLDGWTGLVLSAAGLAVAALFLLAFFRPRKPAGE
ncbi:MAG: putative oxidoreductase [Verrucomicrobiales bacterium]|jgi:putative oxidoreductase